MKIALLQNLTARDWITAVEHDGFKPRKDQGSHHNYKHADGRRVLIMYHNLGDTFGPRTIKKIIKSVGWNEADLKRLDLLK